MLVRFGQTFTAALALIVVASSARAQQTVPFDVNNNDAKWAVAAEFKGRITANAIGLEVSIGKCTLQRPKSFDSASDLTYLHVSVSRPREGQWSQVRSSPRHPLDQTLSPGQKISPCPLVLEIPLGDVEIQKGDFLTFGITSRTGIVYTQAHINLPVPTTGPLSREEIESTLPGEADRALIASAIARRGVQFPLTAETINELAGAANDPTILDAFRALQPGSPPKPPEGQTAEARQLGDEANALYSARNYDAAREKAEAGQKVGSSAAMVVLGLLYETGKGVPADGKMSTQWFRKAADAGNPRGMNDLGNAYMNGRGVTRDLDEGLRLYRQAADAGDAAALSNLGNSYETARGVKQDYFIAFQFFRRSAESDYPNAMNSLGLAYLNGRGTDRNYDSAMRWFRKAAEAGQPAGKYNVGLLYETGRGAQTDAAEAARWYRLAADDGYALAMLKLGHLYEAGTGIPQDLTQAEHFYNAASDAGNAQAKVDLSQLLLRRENGSDRAFQLLVSAAKTGNAEGMYRLAVAYQSGLGTKPDASLANEYLMKAAEAGSFSAVRMLAGRTRLGSPASNSAYSVASKDEAVKVSPPANVQRVDPDYADGARKLGVSGSVEASVVMGENGRITDLYIARPLGFGLDEKVVQALLKYRFQPGLRNGMPVAVKANIMTNFHLGAGPGWRPVQMDFERQDGLLPPVLTSGTWERNTEIVNGTATIEFTVDKSGQPQKVTALNSPSSPTVARIARAVAEWRFTPAEKDGAPVEVRGRVRFDSGKAGANATSLFPPPAPLTLSELRLLIDGGLPDEKLLDSLRARGAAFDLSEDDADALRKAGAGPAVIEAIRANRKPTALESK